MDKWLEEQILEISNRNEQKVLDLRHQIHQDPELSFKEFHRTGSAFWDCRNWLGSGYCGRKAL